MLDLKNIKEHLPDNTSNEEDLVHETVYNLIKHIQDSQADPELVLETL